MKSYTDLEQSKKLAEILPLESADMCYIQDLLAGGKYGEYKPYIGDLIPAYGQDKIKCWSLAALLSVLPDGTDIVKDKADTENEKYMCTVGVKDDIISTFGNNPVDACYEMIIKLYELNLL